MHGKLAMRTTLGYPYAGGNSVTFAQADVRRFGKVCAWGDATTKFVVELRDGALVCIRACDQEKNEERWLRRIAKPVRVRPASREAGWLIFWSEELE